jgi:hypothetical protein
MAPTRIPKIFVEDLEGWATYRREYDLDPYTWIVLRALCEIADWTTGRWEGRFGYLVDAAGLARQTVRRRLKILEHNDLITIERPFGRGDQHPAGVVYVVCYNDLRRARQLVRVDTPCAHEPLRVDTAAPHDQGTFVHNNNYEVVDDDAPTVRSSDNDQTELSLEAERFGYTQLAKQQAKRAAAGRPPITTERGYVIACARNYVPRTRKTPKPSPKAPERSEGLVRPQKVGSVPEEAVEEYQSLSSHMDWCATQLEEHPGHRSRWETKQMETAEALDKLEDEYPGIDEIAFPTR